MFSGIRYVLRHLGQEVRGIEHLEVAAGAGQEFLIPGFREAAHRIVLRFVLLGDLALGQQQREDLLFPELEEELPQTTRSFTRSDSTANSMAAAVELVLPVTDAGGTMLPTFFTTNKSPGWLCVINSASTRESEQVMNSVCGFCPSRESLRNRLR